MQLRIDATTTEADKVELYENGQLVKSTSSTNTTTSMLELFDHLLKQSNSSPHSIDEIHVEPGPGTRFTRTRLSVAFANALGFALKIPVNQQAFIISSYSREPNITTAKSNKNAK